MKNPQYSNLQLIGHGAMGKIYKAVHKNLGIEFVIKECDLQGKNPKDFGYDPSDPSWMDKLNEDFKKEALMLVSLKHENVVGMREFFTDGNLSYLVMEYVNGIDMNEHVETHKPISEDDVIKCGVDLAGALVYIHGKGIVHRDVKPANIMKTNGMYVLIDFGIARKTNTRHTKAMGTPEFSALEQFRNQATEKSDLFSAGASLYYILTGEAPLCPDYPGFENQIQQLVQKRPDVNPGWVSLLKDATVMDQAKRLDARQLYEGLENLVNNPITISNAQTILHSKQSTNTQLRVPTTNPVSTAVRSAARKPSVSVVRDYLVLKDVECVDADGNVFEHYDELLVAKDIERNNKGTLIKFIPYDAVVHFEGMGLFLPSFALSCNIIAALYQNRNNPEMNKILMQYKDKVEGHGWHVQNTIVDFGLEEVIHYPNKADFGGATEVNAHKKRFVGCFFMATLKDELLSKALLDPVKTHYVRQFTGLQDPSVLVEVGNYFGVSTKLWFPWSGRNSVSHVEKVAAWLGCGNVFSVVANGNLGYYDAARGVLLKAP